ncbi:Conserved hypothetical protein [Shewanella piezotolerans WP3]|uniref:Prepilin-type N-terminal cleavage/methylation domain-containing protein n=1 Tax=Shewanella piezotolerans (strain WP3 / JCM 13877) TaxID=225849 RepID=B8CTM7_SHEPW|nr:prepilin-type N-terminal cleavage/methylation domain-containing protein [Shewanella piezotolerans]ACJ31271.1 Conserved hypothetical protein [Shewanella piezotolerans WP3]
MLILTPTLMKQAVKGFSLIEVMVALVISTALVLGVFGVYSSISTTILTSKSLETTQEVVRFSVQVFSRSLKQTEMEPSIVSHGSSLVVEQVANVKACDGSIPDKPYKETYVVVSPLLQCTLTIDGAVSAPKTILNGITAIEFHREDDLMRILVSPSFLPESFIGGQVRIDIALTRIILSKAFSS